MGDKVVRWSAIVSLVMSPCVVPVLVAQSVAAETATPNVLTTATVTVHADGVPLERVLQSIARQSRLHLSLTEDVLPLARRVTLHVRDMSAAEAFRRVLEGTGVAATVVSGIVVFRKTGDASAGMAQGRIVGKVVDANTRSPLAGATVVVSGVTNGTSTRVDGTFQFPSVTSGSHTVSVRMVGYVKMTMTVTVFEGQSASVVVALEPSVPALDRLIVTGTVVPTRLRVIPNAITVVTAEQIRERGITRIDELFRGDIPGLFVPNQGSLSEPGKVVMFSRGATALSSESAGTEQGTNPIKTYVDGVELANSKYLSQIDPESIERIEILSGPQASTIYGSNALNGVMRIFTKRGRSSQPAVTATLSSGWIQNNFSAALTPQHDDQIQVNGVESRLSYNAGGSWSYTGPWTPAKQEARTSGYGGARLALGTPLGAVTTDVSLRLSTSQNRQRGPQDQPRTHYWETGWYSASPFGLNLVTSPTTQELTGQTLGLTVTYAPTRWWSHELTVGQDVSSTEQRGTALGYTIPDDTLLFLAQGRANRRSLSYTTTTQLPLTSFVDATVTLGGDMWQTMTSSMSVQAATLTGTLPGSSVARSPDHNAGGFVQVQLGLMDRLFFTYGLRAEWNPNFGSEAEPNYAPRYGVAFTQNLGALTAKVRASYGRSTRPPASGKKQEQRFSEAGRATYVPLYGDSIYNFANTELRPEHQQGGEGGLDVYLGTRGSLSVTRYNQKVVGLNAAPVIDSVRSLAPLPFIAQSRDLEGYGYTYQYQYLNIGNIRNEGWELRGSMNLGSITTRGTYSWTKSRTLGVDPAYRASLLGFQYQPGASFTTLPEHTWAAGITYARARTTITLDVTGTGQLANLGNELSATSLSSNIRLPQNRLSLNPRYQSVNRGYALGDMTATHFFSAHVDGFVHVKNLTDRYTNDYSAQFAVMGRQTKAGIRLRWK